MYQPRSKWVLRRVRSVTAGRNLGRLDPRANRRPESTNGSPDDRPSSSVHAEDSTAPTRDAVGSGPPQTVRACAARGVRFDATFHPRAVRAVVLPPHPHRTALTRVWDVSRSFRASGCARPRRGSAREPWLTTSQSRASGRGQVLLGGRNRSGVGGVSDDGSPRRELADTDP